MEGYLKSLVRVHCVQFLYQCDLSNIFFFTSSYFDQFVKDHEVDSKLVKKMHKYLNEVFDNLDDIDSAITKVSKNWSLERMASTDRAILRLAAMEVMSKKAPLKVVINEALELAKKYGSEHSSRFVNGILDQIGKNLAVNEKC